MSNIDLIQLTKESLWLVLLLSAPPILVASVIGLLVAFLQTVTQLQEQTFAYTAKFIGIVLTIFLTVTLLGGTLFQFSDRIFKSFPGLVR